MTYAGSRGLRAARIALLIIGTVASSAWAQSVSGTILGTVSDASGGVISHAKVTVLNEGTALTRTVTADSNDSSPSSRTGPNTRSVICTAIRS